MVRLLVAMKFRNSDTYIILIIDGQYRCVDAGSSTLDFDHRYVPVWRCVSHFDS